MIDLSKIRISSIQRSESDLYKDFNGNPLPVEATSLIDVFEEWEPPPCEKPTFVTAVNYDKQTPGIVKIQVDFLTGEMIKFSGRSRFEGAFPEGFFLDQAVKNEIFRLVKQDNEYDRQKEIYIYARDARRMNQIP